MALRVSGEGGGDGDQKYGHDDRNGSTAAMKSSGGSGSGSRPEADAVSTTADGGGGSFPPPGGIVPQGLTGAPTPAVGPGSGGRWAAVRGPAAVEVDEVVEFEFPHDKCRITVSCLPRDVSREELARLFSGAGLVHSVSMFPAHANILYYCVTSARRALRYHGRHLRDVPIEVYPARYTAQQHYRINASQCMDVMNYFVGFNGWSSQVEYAKWITSGCLPDGHPFSVWEARVIIASDGVQVTGKERYVVNDAQSMEEDCRKGRRKAIARARLAAFKQLQLILLDGGKPFGGRTLVCRKPGVLADADATPFGMDMILTTESTESDAD